MDHATTEMYLGEGLPPADFDAFWDTAMERDCAAPVSCILEPAAFRCPIAQCFHMTFPGAGGDRIHALYLRPAGAGKACHPALLMFHGYTWNAGGFAQKLSYVAMGFSVLAMDCRGQGGATPDRSAAQATPYSGIYSVALRVRQKTCITFGPSWMLQCLSVPLKACRKWTLKKYVP